MGTYARTHWKGSHYRDGESYDYWPSGHSRYFKYTLKCLMFTVRCCYYLSVMFLVRVSVVSNNSYQQLPCRGWLFSPGTQPAVTSSQWSLLSVNVYVCVTLQFKCQAALISPPFSFSAWTHSADSWTWWVCSPCHRQTCRIRQNKHTQKVKDIPKVAADILIAGF